MTWWIWILIGIGLAVMELGTPGFFIIFLSAGAVAAGLTAFLAPTASLTVQILVFSLVSVVSLVLFRGKLMRRYGLDQPPPSRDEIVNEVAVPMEDIAPGATGKAELRGTTWNARNAGGAVLSRGSRCRVERVDGLTLWLRND